VSPKRIIVIGDVMLDVIVQPTAPLAPTSDTPANVRMGRGGSGANVAVAMAGAGHDVTYVGVVGNDVAAEQFIADLERAGVRASLERAEGSTGVVVALISNDGQRAMMTDRGVNARLTLEAVLLALEGPFDHLHLSGYTLLDPSTRGTGTTALERAGSIGASTSVDVCSVGPLVRVTPPIFLEAARPAATMIANEEEALCLSGTSDVEEAAQVLARDFEEVLITRGDKGALVRADGQSFSVLSLRVQVLDTTGAGDAASGAYLGARLDGLSVDESLNQAMAAAAHVVSGLGSSGQSRL
jgi:sugar/nucleoside kinase (ribokinase family)